MRKQVCRVIAFIAIVFNVVIYANIPNFRTKAEAIPLVGNWVTPNVESADGGEYQSVCDFQNEYRAAGITEDRFTTIANAQYITGLTTTSQFGENKWGSCASVAAVVLMQFYRQKYYLSIFPKTSTEFNLKYPIPSDAIWNGHNLGYDNTSDESVYEKVHKYFFYHQQLSRIGEGSNWATGLAYGVNRYMAGQLCFQDALVFNLVYDGGLSWINHKNKIISLIDQDTPVYTIIDYYGYNKDTPQGQFLSSHAVVIYGYYVASNGETYYLLHMGWAGTNRLAIVNARFVYGDAQRTGTFTYNASQMHSHNTRYEKFHESQHYVVCSSCSYYDIKPHHFQKKGAFYVCSDCGQRSTSGVVINGEENLAA